VPLLRPASGRAVRFTTGLALAFLFAVLLVLILGTGYF